MATWLWRGKTNPAERIVGLQDGVPLMCCHRISFLFHQLRRDFRRLLRSLLPEPALHFLHVLSSFSPDSPNDEVVCWKLFEARRGVHQEGIGTPQHWRIWDEAVATPHHTALRHVTRGYDAVQNGIEPPRKYLITCQGPYICYEHSWIPLYSPLPSPPPLRAIMWTIWVKSGVNVEVCVWGGGGGGWGGKYCTRSWACILHIEGVVSQIVLHGIVSCWHRVESDYTGYICEPPSTDHWPTGDRHTNRPTVNRPLTDH